DVQAAALADGSEMHVAIEHFDVRIGLDLAAADIASAIHRDTDGLDSLAHNFERNLFQVENDVSRVLDDAWNGAEFVLDPLDAHGRDCGALDGAEQHAAETIADGRAEAALERLRRKHAIPLGERFGIGD